MAHFINITEKPPRYQFLDDKCIGRRCFHPVLLDRGRAACNNNTFHGCPDPLPPFDKAAADRRKAEGWRLSK